MSNHWDGAQIQFVSIISLTRRAESLPTPILPQLCIQMFGNTDAKENENSRVVGFNTLSCEGCICVCVRTSVCVCDEGCAALVKTLSRPSLPESVKKAVCYIHTHI